MSEQNRTPKTSDQLRELLLTPREAGFVCTTFNAVLIATNIYAIHRFP